MEFSKTIILALKNKKISVADFASEMNFSLQHTYGLLRNSKRWNEDSINKACDVLGLRIEIK